MMILSDEEKEFLEAHEKQKKMIEENRKEKLEKDKIKFEEIQKELIENKKKNDEKIERCQEIYQKRKCQFCGSKEQPSNDEYLHYFNYNQYKKSYICKCEGYYKDIAEEEKKEKIKKLNEFRSSVIEKLPKLYKNYDFNNFIGLEDIVIKLKELSKTNASVFISGGVGCGKTHLSIALMKKILANNYGRSINYSYSFSNFNKIVDLYFEDKNTFEEHKSTDLLIIDDLGIEQIKDFKLQKIYDLIDYRYINELQTIITSNLNIEEIALKFGDRISSRIVQMCCIIKIDAGDYRINLRKV